MNKSEINEIKNLFRIKDCENTYCRSCANLVNICDVVQLLL